MTPTVLYLLSLFVYFVFWSALSYYEKMQPCIISKIGANVGLVLLVAAGILAFFVMKWWIVLLSAPIVWFVGGLIGGKIARRLHIPMICLYICVFALSVMYHTYIIIK